MASILRISKYLAGFTRLHVPKYSANTVAKVLIDNTGKCFSTGNFTRVLESLQPQPNYDLASVSSSLLILDRFAKTSGRVKRFDVDKLCGGVFSGGRGKLRLGLTVSGQKQSAVQNKLRSLRRQNNLPATTTMFVMLGVWVADVYELFIRPNNTVITSLFETFMGFGNKRRQDMVTWNARGIMAVYKLIGLVTSSEALMIIQCCGQLMADELPDARTRLAMKLWKHFETMGIDLNVQHYNVLLRVYIENEHDFSPKDFLNLLKTKGIEPDRVTYLRLMSRYCQQGDLEGATGILQIMRDEQLPINVNVFNTLVMGHCQAGDMPNALATLDLMEASSVLPSSGTYRALLCGYAKAGDMEGITGTLQTCEKKQIFLKNADYFEVIYTLAANGWNDHLNKMISQHVKKSSGYNQDCVTLILRLVNINQLDAGFKMLETMIPHFQQPDDQPSKLGSFFIQQLVKTKQPAEKIIAICKKLEDDGAHTTATQFAAKASLGFGESHADLSLVLLRELQKTGDNAIPIHNFWPLLVSSCKLQDKTGLVNLLKCMTQELGLTLNVTTLRARLLPFLPKDTPSAEMINLLEAAQNAHVAATFGVLLHRLENNDIAEAAIIAASYPVSYVVPLLRRPLTTAYLHSKDVESYIPILCGAVRHASQHNTRSSASDVIGRFVIELTEQLATADSNSRVPILEAVLQGLLNKNLRMKENAAQFVRKMLGDNTTEKLSTLIGEITAGETESLSLNERRPKTIPEIESMISTLGEQDSERARHLEIQLLEQYCREFNSDKVVALREKLEKTNNLPVTTLMALIDCYLKAELLDDAWSTYQTLKQQSYVSLSNWKIITLANLLAKNDRFSDCAQLLLDNVPTPHVRKEPTFGYRASCSALLYTLSEKGKVEELETISKILVNNHYLEPGAFFCGPMVKVHLVRNDMAAAVDTFKRSCSSHRVTPQKNEICNRLIMLENLDMLQEVTDLSNQIHGEINTIIDLIFSFLQCGKMSHAKRILESTRLTARPNRIRSCCNYVLDKKMYSVMDDLLLITLDHAEVMNRSLIYDLYIKHCAAVGNEEKRAELVARKESELGPDRRRTSKKSEKNENSEQNENSKKSEEKETSGTRFQVREQYNSNGPLTMEQITMAEPNMEMYTLAKDFCAETLAGKIDASTKDLLFVISHLASAGDVNQIQLMRDYFSNLSAHKNVKWEHFLCLASIKSGKAEEYISKLQHQIDEVTDENLKSFKHIYPKSATPLILKHQPELRQQFEDMARSYAVRDILSPINDLWAHLFVSGEESQAGELWSEFLEKQPGVRLGHVTKEALLNKDPVLVQRVLNQVKSSDKQITTTAYAYSYLINIYVDLKQTDEALKTLEEATKDGARNLLHFNAVRGLYDLLKPEDQLLLTDLLAITKERSASLIEKRTNRKGYFKKDKGPLESDDASSINPVETVVSSNKPLEGTVSSS